MTTPPETVVSIIITNWNTCELLDGALDSVAAACVPVSTETLVIDNGSADGSPDMVAEKYPWVKLIRNAGNLGFARANNQGLAAACGKYVLFLGSDTILQKETVPTLASFLDAHPQVGAAGCRLLNPDGTPQMSCRRFPRLRDAVATYLSLHSLAHRYTMKGFDFYSTQAVDQPAATCLMARRDLLNALRGFDEQLTILYNDVDLCQRIKAGGWEIYFNADTEIIHYGSMTTSAAPPGVRLEMYRNILRYFRSHDGPLARWVLTPILVVRLFLLTRSSMAFRLFALEPENWQA
jgi:GT2 family glycosyltransferase